jgi:hypothetical protein
MTQTAYIESTIPSFYHEVRDEPEMVARRNWTRLWWDVHSVKYDLVTSEAVLSEIRAGDYPNQDLVIAMMDGIALVHATDAIAEIVDVYVAHGVMPADPLGDALHLALASYHRCDFLLTWNCRHIANARKFAHIRRVNSMLGLFTPALATPLELLGEDDNEG